MRQVSRQNGHERGDDGVGTIAFRAWQWMAGVDAQRDVERAGLVKRHVGYRTGGFALTSPQNASAPVPKRDGNSQRDVQQPQNPLDDRSGGAG